jgi:hypothetical protein
MANQKGWGLSKMLQEGDESHQQQQLVIVDQID